MRATFRAKLEASLQAESGGDYDDEHRIVRFDGSTGWILLRGKTFFAENPQGRQATRSIGLVVDITTASAARRRTRCTPRRSSPPTMPSSRSIRNRNHPHVESRRRAALWLSRVGSDRPALSILHDQDRLPESVIFSPRTMGGEAVILETVRRHKDGRMIPVGISGSPIFDAEGRVVGVAAVHRDMTENRQHEEHLRLRLRELSHRTKNMLAVVQGLSHMIARRSDGIEDFESRFHGCIQALAYSHDLLVQHEWQGATLEELLRVQLAPFGGLDGARFAARGPEVYLRAAGDAIARADPARACHQRDQARCAVQPGRRHRDRLDGGGGRRLRLTWAERGGPPGRSAPAQRVRTGRVRADRSVAGGKYRNRIPPRGLLCTVPHRRGKPARAGLVRGVRQPLRPFPKARQDNLVILFQ